MATDSEQFSNDAATIASDATRPIDTTPAHVSGEGVPGIYQSGFSLPYQFSSSTRIYLRRLLLCPKCDGEVFA